MFIGADHGFIVIKSKPVDEFPIGMTFEFQKSKSIFMPQLNIFSISFIQFLKSSIDCKILVFLISKSRGY